MTKFARSGISAALVIGAAVPLAACISFGAKPPESLLAIRADSTVPVGEARTTAGGRSITVLPIFAPTEVGVPRVPVRSSPTELAYLKDAQWVESPARMFRQLLSDVVSARTGRSVLHPRQSQVDPGARLSGELRSFGVEAATNEVVVTYDANLVRGGDNAPVEERRFEARVPVAEVKPGPVGIALNQAANQVAVEVSDWVGK